MTVSTSTSRIAYTGNGVTTSFSVPFPFIQDDYLIVIRTVIATGAETVLTLNSVGPDGYSVTGAGGPSGNVIVVTAPTALERLSIIRSVDATQEADFVANDPLPSEVIEDSLDKLTMLFGDLAGANGLSRVPILYAGDIDGSGRYNSNGNRYANAADGVDPDDLATVQQVIAAGSGNFIQAGSGAVTRTMQDKAREVELSVLDFATIAEANAAAAVLAGAVIAGRPEKEVTLVFPAGVAYTAASTLTFSEKINVRMDGALTYTGSANEPAVVIGAANASANNRRHRVRVVRQSQSDWSSEDCIGVRIYNHNTSVIEVDEASNFTIGLQLMGDSAGFAYCNVTLGTLNNNKYGLDITNDDSTGIGWCNENIFINGRFSVNTGVNTTLARYAVRFNSLATSKYYNNNNVFVKPSFEMNAAATSGEAVPVLSSYGQMNHFLEVRDEGNDAPFMRQENASTENSVTFGFLSLAAERAGNIVETTGSSPAATVLLARQRHIQDAKRCIFASGPLHKRACYADGATSVNVPDVNIASSSNATAFSALSSLTLNDNYLEFGAGRGVGVYLRTDRCKSFVVRRDLETANPGRVAIQCFDSSGTILTSAGGGHPYVRTSAFQTVSWDTSYGGVYLGGSDDANDFWFEVGAAVAYVRVLCVRGTANLRIRSFEIDAAAPMGAGAVWTGVEEVVPGSNTGTAAPTAGTWTKGRVVWNSSPDAGENLGWVCVTAGTPGTWVPFGGIQSASAYTATNVTTDRTFDADTVAVAELADIVGTMIADLKLSGVLK